LNIRPLLPSLLAQASNLDAIGSTAPDDITIDLKIMLSRLPKHVRALIGYLELSEGSSVLFSCVVDKAYKGRYFQRWKKFPYWEPGLTDKLITLAIEEIERSGKACQTCNGDGETYIENKWYTCEDCNGRKIYIPKTQERIKMNDREWRVWEPVYKDIIGWLLMWNDIATNYFEFKEETA